MHILKNLSMCLLFAMSGCAKQSSDETPAAPSLPPIVKQEKAVQLFGYSRFGGGGWIAGHIVSPEYTGIVAISPEGERKQIMSDVGNTWLQDINRNGVIIGTLTVNTDPNHVENKLFVYSPENGLALANDIVPSFNGKKVIVKSMYAISNHNVIVGVGGYERSTQEFLYVPDFTSQAFVWNLDDQKIQFIDDAVTRQLDNGPINLPTAMAVDINDNGALALGCGGDWAPCVYGHNGSLLDILSSEPKFTIGSIVSVNSSGKYLINGNTFEKSDGLSNTIYKIYLWSEVGGLVSLPLFTNQTCFANKVNNQNIAVGWCWGDAAKVATAVTWKDGKIYDLNQGLTDQSHRYTQARDIDDDNHVLVNSDEAHGNDVYVLTLTDEFFATQAPVSRP